jgi:hypothetical protein
VGEVGESRQLGEKRQSRQLGERRHTHATCFVLLRVFLLLLLLLLRLRPVA